MANNVANYIKNLGKSVVYSSVDASRNSSLQSAQTLGYCARMASFQPASECFELE
jgi:hypothetical protein